MSVKTRRRISGNSASFFSLSLSVFFYLQQRLPLSSHSFTTLAMQTHPLDLPEVLTLVGSFLPLWVEAQDPLHRLQPKTLSACLRVSKLWYKTLLPVLWYTFSPVYVMAKIPAPIIRRDSHLCRILEVPLHVRHKINLSPFNCTHLVEATLFHGQRARIDTEGGKGGGKGEDDGQQPQQQLVKALSDGQRLLRSNPHLKRLDWTGIGTYPPVLDTEDFAGLKELDTLSLLNWNCSNGELRRLLGVIGRSLKLLKLSSIKGVQPEELSTSLSSPKEEGDTGVANGDDAGWALSRLEVLEWFSYESDGDYLSNLVKRCPNLKSFKIRLDLDGVNWTSLAGSLRTHCSNLEALIVITMSPVPFLEPFIKNGPAPSVLRKLEINCEGPDYGLIAAILHHASTLKDLCIARKRGGRMDATGYCRLLFECPRLTSFGFSTRMSDFNNEDFMNALMKQRWACRGLQELKFSIISEEEERETVEREMTEEDSAVLCKMGWEYGSPNERKKQDESSTRRVVSTKLWKALEVVLYQDLEQLRLLQLDNVSYRRSSPSIYLITD
ncbi:MAG: hypothetical protein JOS17DRAFT_756422 [Linnemannia elongata]|nr:MAG: hypothetical protein JOS17DRAFT_756422 [Linnemannia elongata]